MRSRVRVRARVRAVVCKCVRACAHAHAFQLINFCAWIAKIHENSNHIVEPKERTTIDAPKSENTSNQNHTMERPLQEIEWNVHLKEHFLFPAIKLF